jgi:hypothetical protein
MSIYLEEYVVCGLMLQHVLKTEVESLLKPKISREFLSISISEVIRSQNWKVCDRSCSCHNENFFSNAVPLSMIRSLHVDVQFIHEFSHIDAKHKATYHISEENVSNSFTEKEIQFIA